MGTPWGFEKEIYNDKDLMISYVIWAEAPKWSNC